MVRTFHLPNGIDIKQFMYDDYITFKQVFYHYDKYPYMIYVYQSYHLLLDKAVYTKYIVAEMTNDFKEIWLEECNVL